MSGVQRGVTVGTAYRALGSARVRHRVHGAVGRTAALLLLVPTVASAIWLTLTNPRAIDPQFDTAFAVYIIVAPVLIGLAWWRERPAIRVGPLLIALGLLGWLLTWQASSDPWTFTLGVVAEGAYIFLLFYLCLAFPRGRLIGGLERNLMTIFAVDLVVIFAVLLAAAPNLAAPGPISPCWQCPRNPFQVAETLPWWALATLIGVVSAVAVAVALSVVAIQIVRLVRASAPQRRERWPVVAAFLLLMSSFVLYIAEQALATAPITYLTVFGALYAAALIIFPLSFLVVLVRQRLFAASANRHLVEGLGVVPTPHQLQGWLAAALDDPGLRVGLWDRRRRRFIDEDGLVMSATEKDAGQVWVPILKEREPVAAIVADEALTENPDLLEAARAATIVAVEEEHDLEDVLALRSAVIQAIDGERQRIVRDMHDGAQQRLVALRVQLGLAIERMDNVQRQYEEMVRLGHELDAAIVDLRDLSRQFLSPFVTRNGVGPAIGAATRNWPIDVQVTDAGVGRHPADAEVAVYNCCMEALRNTLEHAGQYVRVRVRLYEAAGALMFEVSDNGVGFDPATTQPGVGLTTMADRALLRGGSLRVSSSPGRGVVVVGTIPDWPREVPTTWVN